MPPTSSQRIGIVTCRAEKLADYFPTAAEPNLVPTEPPFTPDDQRLVEELRRRGHRVSSVVWGEEPERLPSRFDRLVVRSPWDYMDSDALRREFVFWLERLAATGMTVDNEPRLMLWLMDKRYLFDFASAGVPIVPTRLISADDSLDLESFVERHGAVVVKPAVSAAGVGLEFLRDRLEARAFQRGLADHRRSATYLVQPFVPEIRTHGEWSLVYLGGEFSHAVHKLPAAGQIMVHAERGGTLRFADPPKTVRELGDCAASALPRVFAAHAGTACRMPLYLRIDVIETAHGALLSECEGVEPELFFRARPDSVRRFVDLMERPMAG
ncbi:MAG: hypothetical protein Kow0040_08940 [Thermogutta sp.]